MFETLIEKIKTMRKGTYHTIVYRHEEKGYTKTTTMVARLCNYYNMKSTKERGKTAPTTPSKNTITIIPHVLTYNTNTGNYLLIVHPTMSSKSKPQSTYATPSGEPCDSETYYTMSGRKPSPMSETYNIKLQDLVSID